MHQKNMNNINNRVNKKPALEDTKLHVIFAQVFTDVSYLVINI
jgi:hypothetical protein